MAAKRHGANAYLRGIDGTWTNARIQSRKRSLEFSNTDFALDENGRRVEAYQDDLTETLDVDLIVKADFEEPAPGAEVDVITKLGTPNTTKKYVVDKVNDAEGNKEWRKYSLSLVDWEYVELT